MDDAVAQSQMSQLIQKLPQQDKEELQRFIKAETQKSQIQQTIHDLTNMCFKKCITSRISAGKLDKYEESCMENCVNRFLDTSGMVLKHMETMRAG